MVDWAELSKLLTSEPGINGLGDAFIAAAVALLVARWQSRDASKNRFTEEKLLAYERLISRFDVIGDFQLLRAEFAPLLRKRENGEEVDASDAEAQEALNQRLQAILEKCDKHAGDEPTPRELLLTVAVAPQTNRLWKVIRKMKAHVDAGNYEKASRLTLRYDFAHAYLMHAVREDLGLCKC